MGKMILRAVIMATLIWMPIKAAAAVEVQEVTSPGGINAWLVEEHAIPFVAIEIRFRGGSVLDLPGRRGATNLMVGLLEEGTDALDARGFAQAREALAARFRYNVYDDAVSISAQMLTETRDEAVALLKSSLTRPAFNPDAIERVRGQVLAGIRSSRTDPGSIAGDAFFAATFGAHPYGSDRSGTEDTVEALTREDIQTAFENAFALERIYVSAVGDITAEELGQLLDDLLGDIPKSAAPLPERADYRLNGGVEVIDFETPQSVALFGHQGIARDDPDYLAAYVVNEIFGGSGVQSRLTEEVREKRGLTYGVSTFLQPMDYGELVLGQVRSDNDKMARAIEIIQNEWEKLAREGVTAAELADAKTYLTGAFALRFDGNATIARIMVGMQMSGQDVGYLRARNDLVNALTLEEVNRVAARLFDPAGLHFVVVGQPTGLQ